MTISVYASLKNIIELWKKTYVLLLPITLLTVLCFESALLINSVVVSIILCFPGLFFSNVLLLKLNTIFEQRSLNEKEIYAIATKRYVNSLLLFLGLGGIFLFLVLAGSALLGLLFGLVIALLLLVFYSYIIFSYPLVVIDNMPPVLAIKKSFYLINNHIWFITALFLIVGISEGAAYILLFFIVGMKFTSLIYNLLFTTLNLALSVVVLKSLKQQAE